MEKQTFYEDIDNLIYYVKNIADNPPFRKAVEDLMILAVNHLRTELGLSNKAYADAKRTEVSTRPSQYSYIGDYIDLYESVDSGRGMGA